MKNKENTSDKNGSSVFADILSSVTKCFLVLVAVVVLFIAVSGVKIIKSGEVALILRFGKPVGDSYEEQIHEPGLLFAFPYIIDEVITVPTGSVIEQRVTTHYTEGTMTSLHNNGYVITGDQNIAVISASVKYVITDPVAYALKINDISKIINASVSSAMVDEASSVAVDELLTNGKDAFGKAVMSRAQNKLSALGAGVTIGTLEFANVSMPGEVREIYNMVNSASVEASTKIEQANKYREITIPGARTTATTLISEANSRYSAAVAAANNDLAEFYGVLDEYNANADVVKTRIYSAKVSEAIGKIGKVRIVRDGETKIIFE